MIEIIVNGEKANIKDELNIRDMIKALDYQQEVFAIALNGTFVAIDAYETTTIKADDNIEILAPIQGG
ncbi:MAG: sulfur carrier protein ThiS [Epsilonproteobacteria bacterium]|nr:sulfur carrier protein ThiS [Campylobacterota bacterium]